MKMKTSILIACMAMMVTTPTFAQTEVREGNNLPNAMTKLWNKAKNGVKKTGRKVGGFLGVGNEQDMDLIDIDGVEYMPIYTKNLFYSDSTQMILTCQHDLLSKYPSAKILNAVIPQATWDESELHDSGKVVGYRRRAYCYVLATDGNDGYINARYLFMSEKKGGHDWTQVKDEWAKCERVDIIPASAYTQLKEKSK
ncbi:putative uncharacterized protein [Prevotella sp. CAG:924]|nr:putative uncharacterized protein [Prevotella sp. CAG:924]